LSFPKLVGLVLTVIPAAVCPAFAADAVAARVNGVPITVAQVRRVVGDIPDGVEDAAQLRREAFRSTLQSLIDLELLVQQARKKKIEVGGAEVEDQLMEVKAQFESPQAFAQALSAQGATEADVRSDIERQLLAKNLVEQEIRIQLPPGAVEQYYASNIDQFRHPDEVRPSHILFRTPPDRDRKEVKRRAEETLQRIKNGEDFARVASELSEDPDSIQNNGDLGFIRRDEMPKKFTDAAFKLKVGEVSGVVETDFGFHIIKLLDRRAAGVTPLADVRPQIEMLLTEQEGAKRSQEYLKGLREKAKIEVVGDQ